MRKTYQIATYIEPEVADEMKALAKHKDWTLAKVLRAAVHSYLENHKQIGAADPTI